MTKTLNTNKRVWIYMAVLTVFLIIGLAVLWYLRGVFRYLLISILIIYLVTPITKKLQRYGFGKNQALLFVIAGFFLIIFGTVYLFGPGIMKEIQTIQTTWPSIQERIDTQLFTGVYENGVLTGYYIPKLDMTVEATAVEGLFFSVLTQLKSVLKSLLPGLLTALLIVPILTFIIVNDGDKMFRKGFSSIPNKYFEVAISMAYDINNAVQNFIRAKAIQSFIVGAICVSGFWVAGVKFPILLGIMVGFFNIIPLVGPLLGAIPPVVMSYLLADTWTAGMALIVIVMAQLVDNLFTQPVLLPKLVNEHPLVVVLVTLIGAELFGALGLVLAIVIFSILKIIFVKSYQALDVLQSRREAEEVEVQKRLSGLPY